MSIVVESVSKVYGNQKALDNISFTAEKGKILGFLGPNGAGKSTMMKIIVTYINATSGKVFINGTDIQEKPIYTRSIIGYLPEHNPLYHEMYVKEFLRFMAKLSKVKNIKKRVDASIEMVGLQREQHKKIGNLSKGYKQRVGLAQALIHEPEILILDEPTSGLDPNQLNDIRQLIIDLGKERTVMLSTHIMQEVEAICDQIVIINQGKLVANQEGLKIPTKSFIYELKFAEDVNINNIRKIKNISHIKELAPRHYLIECNANSQKEIAEFSLQQKWITLQFTEHKDSLEDIFRKLTS